MNRLLIILLIALIPLSGFTQEDYELEEIFLDADSWFYFEDYKEAVNLFLKVYQADTNNHNLNYKIGFCYLHIEGQKAKSIPYFEKAIELTTPNYRENTYMEKRAPIESHFYLGNAYLVNNELDKAKEAYQYFLNILEESEGAFNRVSKDNYDIEYLNKQIGACEIARIVKQNPVSYNAVNLGSPVNTRFSDYNAVASGDGTKLVLTAEQQFYDAIYYFEKQGDNWGFPINIMGQLMVDDNTSTSSLSFDGTELYLYRNDDFDGNIYVSYFQNGSWSPVEKLNENINTKYWESHAAISPDGKYLYFTSNREGGFGDLDIYVSEKDSTGDWGSPVNIGEPVNSHWNENTPFLSPDGTILYFSSEGHSGMGGYDLFYSFKTNKIWENPINLGYPINNTDDNLFLAPVGDNYAYYSKYPKTGYGGKDIFKIQLFIGDRPSDILVEGVRILDNQIDKNETDYFINIYNNLTHDTITKLRSKDVQEGIALKSPNGNNQLIAEKPITGRDGKQYIISQKYDIKEVVAESIIVTPNIDTTLVPEIELDQREYALNTDQNIKVKLTLQKGNKLFVSTFLNEQLLNSEEFDISDEDFIYEFKPVEGESIIRFQLVDEYNNIQSEEIRVSYIPALTDRDAQLEIEDQTFNLGGDGKSVKIKLSVEENSKLFVETYIDDKLVNTESFDIKQENFVYEFTPTEEKTIINFKLIDQFNNVKNQEIVISHQPIDDDFANLLTALNTYDPSKLSTLVGSEELPSNESSIDFLREFISLTINKGVSETDVNALLTTYILQNTNSVDDFVSGLIKSSSGYIKNDLEQIFNDYPDFTSTSEAIAFMYAKLAEKGYSIEDINNILITYIASIEDDPVQLQKDLEYYASLTPVAIFNNLGSDALDITSVSEFITYLKNKESLTEEELSIISMLEALNLASELNNAVQTYIAADTEEETEIKSKTYAKTILILSFGLILIILLILLIYRRNKKQDK